MKIEGTKELSAPRDTVWAVLNDPEQMAKLMPGVEGFDIKDDRHWTAKVKIPLGLGGLRLTAVEPSGLGGMLTKVANSLTSQYTVTFARPDASAMKPVKMEARGAKVLLSPWLR